MKILYGSDFHSSLVACRRFAAVLDRHDFALGVLGGDITEGFISQKTLLKMFQGAAEDDFLPTLFSPDEDFDDMAASLRRDWYGDGSLLMRGLQLEEERLKTILMATNKPILFIPGNHDRTAWASRGNLTNIHGKSATVGRYNFVGYRYCGLEKTEAEIAKDLRGLEGLIGGSTVLVTHAPPYGTLDCTWSGEYIGSRAVAALAAARKPCFHLFGHVHESRGVRGSAINGSYVGWERFYAIDLAAGRVRAVKTGD
jgi:Icc-related predicted phosphoesterase